MPEENTLRHAATLMSERLQAEGASLSPEFDQSDEVGAAPADDVQDPEEVEASEGEQGTESEAEVGAEAEEDVETFELPGSINELASLLGVDASDMYGLTVNVELGDGTTKAMSLEEAKRLMTEPARDEHERSQWREQRERQEAEIQEQTRNLQEQREQAETLASVVMGGLETEYRQLAEQRTHMLRDVQFQNRDPNAYQVEIMRINAQLEDVGNRYSALTAHVDQVRTQQQQELQANRQKAQRTGQAQLRASFPEWAEDKAWEDGALGVQDYLMSGGGYSKEEMGQLYDWRVYKLAEKARRWDALQERAKQPPKATARPRLVPGAQQVRLPRGRRQELESMERLQKTGSIDDARAVLANRLRNSGT